MDIITLILAIWGAVLSTILGIRELRKDKRSLKIVLEHVNWVETERIIIINTGLRPITIDQVFISVNIKNHGPYDAMPKKAFWSDAEDYKPPKLPLTLEDGKMAVFYVSEFVNEQLRMDNSFLKIEVYDAEGNVYTKYTKSQYDPKYGYRGKPYIPPGYIRSFFTDLLWKIREKREIKRLTKKK